MTPISEVVNSYFEKSIFDIKPPSEQEILNLSNLINHWIKDKNTKRAFFGNISNDNLVTTEFIANNLSAAKELVEVRRVCSKCQANQFQNCPYNQKMLKEAKKYEQDKGLNQGTVNVKRISARPTLICKRGTFTFAYETCPLQNQ